ncbi:MAG: hypothetical protein BWX88_04620 [Planctomycetes bacterium ADurb.Bin126]|nr:MAG: hypothetical protein BWX88_04620 [Planctomycetes bacterium ADurb.Bin126]HOD83927.1 hypothetical protein [Phycisphaerae bacterium]HQL76226.1 hypothetical protein [Phycisphaerae bacterium]
MIVKDDELLTRRIGKLDFTVERAEHTPESRLRWERRADSLTAWLLAEWHREQQSVRNN